MIRLPEIKTAELSTYRNFAKCHQAHFRVSRVGLGTTVAGKSHMADVVCMLHTGQADVRWHQQMKALSPAYSN